MRWTAQGVKNLRRTARNAKRKVKKFIRHGDRDERLVNFLICGTQKGGTTTLNCYLREHPEICVAEKRKCISLTMKHISVTRPLIMPSTTPSSIISRGIDW